MEQKFKKSDGGIDLRALREFCRKEGKVVDYRKGEQLEREGDPARWFAYVERGCFKYVTHGISDDKEHITWFSFEGEFAGDYPACLDGGPALTTIEAMVPTCIIRESGEQLVKRFSQDKKSMDLRCLVAEHLLGQARARYTDLHRATPLERYELLLRRCPGIARHLPSRLEVSTDSESTTQLYFFTHLQTVTRERFVMFCIWGFERPMRIR